MSEENGRLTYFDVEKIGIYKCNGGSVDARFDANYFLESLLGWVNDSKFENTLPTKDDNRLRKRVYCKNAYKCPASGDFFFVLWKSEEDGNGNIQGVDVNSPVNGSSDSVVLLSSDGKGGKQYIWGKPCYYWYIAKLNKFAAIKFPHSSTDTYLFASYIKDYVNYRMRFEGKKISKTAGISAGGKDYNFNTVTFSGDDGESRTQFLFKYKLFLKKAERDTIQKLRTSITHLVYRNIIGTSEADNRSLFIKIFDAFSNEKEGDLALSKERKIELVVEETPTLNELNGILDYYDDGFQADSWNNIGFRENGKNSATKWFNEYVLRDSITVNYSSADKKHISAVGLAGIINGMRDRLVAGLDADKDDNAANDAQGHDLDRHGREVNVK